MTWDQAIETYAISRASISCILNEERKRKQNTESNVLVEHPPQKRGRKSPLANGEILIYILDRFEKDSTLDYNRLHKDIEQKFMIQTSPTAIKDTVSKLDISWKTILPIPVEWNTLSILEARTRFIGSLGGVFLRPLIYVDEKGWNMHIRKSKGHAVKGEPAKLTLVPKGKNITLIGGLTRVGIIHYRFVESLGEKKRGSNAEDFKLFLTDLFRKIPRNSVVILDNCKIHHSEILEGLWDLAKQGYGIDHLYLPPYSPFLNPIEYAWNFLQTEVAKEEWFNRGDLIQTIKIKIETAITPEKAESFFNQSAKYYSACTIGLPFRGKPLNPEIPQEPIQTNLLTSS